MDPSKSKDPQKELEIALGELEERVDRLRALYEQYFMGYEKIEPGVQRKDVDRRFAVLRKQQIRNTALRFRFNVITQKFNTYSMYWTRICRQIEEGTFKRHVARAARRFGNPAQTKREQDISIEVELGDFEDVDLDAILAEADAAAEVFAHRDEPPDTIPPPPPTAVEPPPSVAGPPPSAADPPPSPAPPRSNVRDRAPSVPDAAHEATPPGAPRIARQVALPPGAKPRVVVRRRVEGEARSTPVPRPPMPAGNRPLPLPAPIPRTPGSPMRPVVRPVTPGDPAAPRPSPPLPSQIKKGS